jgi:hypothetical protein
MNATELSHAAALIAAAFVTRRDGVTPEDAARIYFDCLDALVAAAQEHESEQRKVAKDERQPKPWTTSKKITD